MDATELSDDQIESVVAVTMEIHGADIGDARGVLEEHVAAEVLVLALPVCRSMAEMVDQVPARTVSPPEAVEMYLETMMLPEGVADVVYNRALSIIAEQVLPPVPGSGEAEELPRIDVATLRITPVPEQQ